MQIEEAVLKRDAQRRRGHKCNVRGDLSVSPTALHHREVACASYTYAVLKPDL